MCVQKYSYHWIFLTTCHFSDQLHTWPVNYCGPKETQCNECETGVGKTVSAPHSGEPQVIKLKLVSYLQ